MRGGSAAIWLSVAPNLLCQQLLMCVTLHLTLPKVLLGPDLVFVRLLSDYLPCGRHFANRYCIFIPLIFCQASE